MKEKGTFLYGVGTGSVVIGSIVWPFRWRVEVTAEQRSASGLLKRCFEARFESRLVRCTAFRSSAPKRRQPAWFPSLGVDDSGRKGPKARPNDFFSGLEPTFEKGVAQTAGVTPPDDLAVLHGYRCRDTADCEVTA